MLKHERIENSENGHLTFSFEGRVDGESSGSFYSAITQDTPDNFSGLLVDLKEVNYISSDGLRAVLKVVRWCHGFNAGLAISNMSAYVANVFDIADIMPREQVFTSNDAAYTYLTESSNSSS